MRLLVALAVLIGSGLAVRADANPRSDERETFFETRIRPVLATTCVKCHGGAKTENSLRVDRREWLLKGGDSGAAIVPGDPEKSLLIRALRYGDDNLKMPPAKKLPETVIADFEHWVRDGASGRPIRRKTSRNSTNTTLGNRIGLFSRCEKSSRPRIPPAGRQARLTVSFRQDKTLWDSSPVRRRIGGRCCVGPIST